VTFPRPVEKMWKCHTSTHTQILCALLPLLLNVLSFPLSFQIESGGALCPDLSWVRTKQTWPRARQDDVGCGEPCLRGQWEDVSANYAKDANRQKIQAGWHQDSGAHRQGGWRGLMLRGGGDSWTSSMAPDDEAQARAREAEWDQIGKEWEYCMVPDENGIGRVSERHDCFGVPSMQM